MKLKNFTLAKPVGRKERIREREKGERRLEEWKEKKRGAGQIN